MRDIKGKWSTLKLAVLPVDRYRSYNSVDFDITGERGTVLIFVLPLFQNHNWYELQGCYSTGAMQKNEIREISCLLRCRDI